MAIAAFRLLSPGGLLSKHNIGKKMSAFNRIQQRGARRYRAATNARVTIKHHKTKFSPTFARFVQTKLLLNTAMNTINAISGGRVPFDAAVPPSASERTRIKPQACLG